MWQNEMTYPIKVYYMLNNETAALVQPQCYCPMISLASHKCTAGLWRTWTRGQATPTGIQPNVQNVHGLFTKKVYGASTALMWNTKPTGLGNTDVLWHIFQKQIAYIILT